MNRLRRMDLSRSARCWTPWIVAVLSVVFYAAVCAPVLPYSAKHDFLSFYTGATVARGGDFHCLYDLEFQAAQQDRIVPGIQNIAPYLRPPFYAVLLIPLSLLPLHAAFAVWISAGLSLLCWIWWWTWRTFGPDALVFSALFLPTAYGIAHGQDCVFVAAAILASWIAMRRGNDLAAGAIGALALIKFHLLILFVPALLLRRKWAMLAGFAGVGIVEAGVSFALIGPAGVRQYAGLLHNPNLATLHPSPERMINVHGLLANAGFHHGWIAAVPVAAFTLLVAWYAKDDWLWFWGAIAGAILAVPHAYQYDAALLLVPLLAGIFRGSSASLRMVAATAALPLPYLFTLFGKPWAAVPPLLLLVWFALMFRPRCDTIAVS